MYARKYVRTISTIIFFNFHRKQPLKIMITIGDEGHGAATDDDILEEDEGSEVEDDDSND